MSRIPVLLGLFSLSLNLVKYRKIFGGQGTFCTLVSLEIVKHFQSSIGNTSYHLEKGICKTIRNHECSQKESHTE